MKKTDYQDLETSVINQQFSGAYSMGTAKRNDLSKNDDIPAPNQYQSLYDSMLTKNDSFFNETSMYKEQRLNRVQGSKWGKEKRKDIYSVDKNIPPPGTYELKSDIEQALDKKQGATISAVQFKDVNFKNAVGPFDYENDTLKIKKKNPQAFIGYKDEDPTSKYTYMKTPGPQKYSYKTSLSTKVSHNKKQTGFGSGDKNSIYKKDSATNPGPGSYSYQNSNFNKYQQTIGRSKRAALDPKEKENVPGAGSYNIDQSSFIKANRYARQLSETQQINNSLSKTKGSKISQSSTQIQAPGPGHYQTQSNYTKYKSPAFKIGSSQRQPLNIDSKVPGPGQYNQVTLSNNISHADLDYFQGFGTQPKNMAISTDLIGPGPQKYQSFIYSSFGTNSRRANQKNDMSLKVIRPEQQPTPGPASYDPQNSQFSKNNIKGVSMKRKNYYNHDLNTPGPGSYILNNNNNSLYSTNGYRFAQSQRMGDQEEKSIFQTSPSSYIIKSSIGAFPKYLKQQQRMQND